jgi:hypothetical protein
LVENCGNSFATIGGLLTDSKTYFLSGQINALEQSGMVRTACLC